MMKSLDLIPKCWASDEPFDWNGTHWQGTGIVTTRKPMQQPLSVARWRTKRVEEELSAFRLKHPPVAPNDVVTTGFDLSNGRAH